MREKILLAGLLTIVCIITAAAHLPVLSAGAVSYDDDQFLTDYNPLVQKPSLTSAWQILNEVLSPSSVKGYYQPLSVISIMLDYAAGGNAKNLLPFHRTNLILHVLNTALLIVLLYIIFGDPVPAAIAGLLFGVHPLTVEPVAWISDRKTLLAMLFALLCLIFYVRYARTNNWRFYIASLSSYFLAMMSKPTSLPLCAALLVMDYWPLQRLNSKLENIKALILEKLRFFVLAAIFAVITVISNSRSVSVPPVGASAANSLLQLPLVICYLISFYLNKIIWPVNLSSTYLLPEPLSLSNPNILGGIIVTAMVVIVLLYSARRSRVFLAGGLFSLVLISPTLGLVRFSSWVTASDKYVYMPAIGLIMILAWLFSWLWKTAEQKFASIKPGLIALVLLLSAGEVYGVRQYLTCWHNTETLYEYMLKLTPNAGIVHNNLGVAYGKLGRYQDAIESYKQAIAIKPDFAEAYCNLGNAYGKLGRYQEAIQTSNQAIKIKPDLIDAHYNLGVAYGKLGRYQDEIEAYGQAIRIKPNYAEAYCNLGAAYINVGRYQEAIDACEQAVKIKPDYAEAYCNLGYVYGKLGRPQQEIEAYRSAIKIKPDFAKAYCNLGVAYGKLGRYQDEMDAYRQAIRIKPDFVDAHFNLAVAYLMAGDKNAASQECKILKEMNTVLADRLSDLINKAP